MRKSTFQNMLDSFFKDNQLKAVLSFPLLGNSGLPPSMLSAFIGAKIFKEFLLDGGYYPAKGMQDIPDTLVKKYQEFGGDLRLSCHVKKIRALDNTVSGVYLEKFGFCPSRYVISNCDSRETFFKLVGRKMLPESFMETVRAMKPSLSVFVLYLGLKNDSVSLPPPGINVWYMPTYNIEKAYRDARKGIFFNNNGYLIHVSPDKKTILAFMTAPFKNKKYWDENKQKIKEIFTLKIQSEAIPGLSKHVAYSDAATPYTLFRYTSNYRGASYGWASTPSQLALPDFRKPSFLKNLYCTGHWTTLGLGLPGVAYIGYDTAKNILRREKRIHCGTKPHMKA
jgi:prolycopene isomerase